MRKSVKLILIICSIILISGLVFGYMIYSITHGSEEIAGKSPFAGIKTDWSDGLTKLWQVDYLCQGSSSATWPSPVVKGNRLIVMGRDEVNDIVF